MKGSSWNHRLHKTGFRLTNQRATIIDIMQNTGKHLSADEIYIHSRTVNPSVSLTTVYRTLDLFSQIGVVQKFDFGDGKARYELINDSPKKEHHHHLICLRCKTIIDYAQFIDEELELINKTEKKLSKKLNFKITHHIIHLYGLCEKCRS